MDERIEVAVGFERADRVGNCRSTLVAGHVTLDRAGRARRSRFVESEADGKPRR